MRDTKTLRVHFSPDNLEVMVAPGENLLRAAQAAGVHLNASCGGNGVCGTCHVRLKKGEVKSSGNNQISPEDFERGCRLACQSQIVSDLEVDIPAESRMETAVVNRELGAVAGARAAEAVASNWRFNPPVNKYFVELPAATMSDNVSDLSRLLRGLKERPGLASLSVDYEVLKSLPRALREQQGRVTATTLAKAAGTGGHETSVIRVEAGDTSHAHYSLALDIGTTTVCGELLDLARGLVLAEAMAYNGQIRYGADVISRIAHSQTPGGLKSLQKAVVATVNQVIDELVRRAGVSARDIGCLTVAGNTTMTHLLLGLDPKYLRLAPYTPVASFIPPARARSLGIKVDKSVYLFVFPSVASYVGGDIVSGVVGVGMHQRQKLTLYIDIGTNGEIVIGSSDWMVTTACSAGPAFEGGGIRHGMMAGAGAIEAIEIDPLTLEPKLKVIGEEKPKGICGSGLISTVAELMESGLIGQNGKFHTGLATPRVRQASDGYEYALAYAADTQTGRDIVLTEVDIDNLIRAKAAMYAGYQTLLGSVGASPADIDEVIIAGAFGSHLDIERAVTIGLLPDLPQERFIFAGNGSLTGARLVAFSIDLLGAARRVAAMMTNLELAERADFMDNYVAALFLPHTNAAEFPAVSQRLAALNSERRRAT